MTPEHVLILSSFALATFDTKYMMEGRCVCLNGHAILMTTGGFSHRQQAGSVTCRIHLMVSGSHDMC